MQTDGHGPWRDDGKLPYGRWRLPCGHGNRERAYASVRLVETFFSYQTLKLRNFGTLGQCLNQTDPCKTQGLQMRVRDSMNSGEECQLI